MDVNDDDNYEVDDLLSGATEKGGELGIYKVKFLKTGKISFFLLHRGPLGKICSVAPAYAA